MDQVHGRCRRGARPCSRLQRETLTRHDRTFSTAREDGAPTCRGARTSRSPNPRIFCLSWSRFSWSHRWRRPSCFSSRDFHRHSRTWLLRIANKILVIHFLRFLELLHYRLSCSVITFRIVVFAVSGRFL